MNYRTFFISACLSAALLTAPAFAESTKMPTKAEHADGGHCARMAHFTLDEAREHTKKHLDELNAMSPKEWDMKQKERREHCEYWRDKRKAAETSAPQKK